MTETSFNDDDGCYDNYDDSHGNFDDDYDKHCQRHNGPRVLTL